MTLARTWTRAGSALAFLLSALTLISQIVSVTHPMSRLETRELIVRADDDGNGPAIVATASDRVVSLMFTDPGREVPPISLTYSPASDTKIPSDEIPHIAIVVDDARAELRAEAGRSGAVLSSSLTRDKAQLQLSSPDGGARLTAARDGTGLRSWSRRHEIELMSYQDSAKLSLRGDKVSAEARIDRDRTGGFYLASGTAGAASSLATTEKGSSLLMTDPGGNTPIELTSGQDGRIRLTPGPKGCLDLDGTGDGC